MTIRADERPSLAERIRAVADEIHPYCQEDLGPDELWNRLWGKLRGIANDLEAKLSAPAGRMPDEPKFFALFRRFDVGTDQRAIADYADALRTFARARSEEVERLNGVVVTIHDERAREIARAEAAETLAATATQRADGMEADARRYRGVRSLKYKMYVADARSLGPQMKWQSEEAFNATYDSRHDAAIDAALSAAAESGE